MKTKIVPENRLKCIEIALLIGLAVFLISGGLALRTQTRLADRVVRLHVLANSDGEEDQALKLLVRDRVLAQDPESPGQLLARGDPHGAELVGAAAHGIRPGDFNLYV